jgi:hypothetical protein
MQTCRFATLSLLGGLAATAPAAHATIKFDFDYSFEPANGFFAQNPAAKLALERASATFSDRLLDKLPAIVPAASFDTWNAVITNPSTGAATVKPLNPGVAADTIKVYIGAYNLGGALGLGGPGGYEVSGTQEFIDSIQFRGQPGAAGLSPTDFGSWGGAISFDTTANWNFNLAGPQSGRNDFLTVAVHELAHVLGFGTANSWDTFVAGDVFTGAKAVARRGSNVPLSPDGAHFNYGTQSTVGGVAQETIMDPDITTGTRKLMTLLDWAALDDFGWDLARPGDANADGSVNFADLLTLAKNYNQASDRRWSAGDFNYDGFVNFSDLLDLAKNYNTSGPQPGALPESASAAFSAEWSTAQAAVAAVPEPTAGALLAILATPALALRRRR